MQEDLLRFGLTKLEAGVYMTLDENEGQTGYEVAKELGVSRSNVYTALTALVDKGAVYIVEEKVQRYVRVKIEEFCDNYIRALNGAKQRLIAMADTRTKSQSGYITIKGAHHTMDKVIHMLKNVESRVYLSLEEKYLSAFVPELQELVSAGKKVVIITDKEIAVSGIQLHQTQMDADQIGMIVDSREVLTGEILNKDSTCLYSNNENLVYLFKKSLRNEIRLIGVENEA